MADPTKIAQFTSITGADQPTAEFFLSASHGNIDAAVSAFFESDGMVPSASEAARPHTSRPSQRPPNSKSAARPSRAPGFATLDSLPPDEEEDDEEDQEYYAGGEKSGQMIQGPRRRDDEGGPSSLADAIFERAQERGPRTDEEREEFEGPQMFSGAGYRLGDRNTGARTRPDIIGSRNVTRVLTFYANGFTVDDGPLRTFDDPENEEFLSDVNKGAVPKEMEEPGVEGVSITLVDKKDEEYRDRPKVIPFSGSGQRLDGGGESNANAAVDKTADTERATAAVTVDESRPIATVQVRLSNGTRVIVRLNEDNTVGDLRQLVRAESSSRDVGGFVLSTTFPRKALDDDAKTIKEAGLKGAVVVQTLK